MKLLDAIFEGAPVCPVAPGQTNLVERKLGAQRSASRIVFGLALLLTLAGCGSLTAQESENDSNVVEGISGETDRAAGEEADGQKRATPTNAQACSTGSDCASGFCADGVCCNQACTGTCQACTAAKKGSGADGTCGPIAFDTDPDNECANGGCDGAGTCRLYNGLPCAGPSDCLSYCVDGFCCGSACTGTCQSCSAAKKGSGYDGVCGPIALGTDPDDECGAGACTGGGTCSSGSSNACTSNAACPSGFCVDGVCCDQACTGTCQACTAAQKGSGVDGICGPIAFDTDPDNECANGGCSGTGTCQLYNGLPCAGPSDCLAYCVDGVCCGNLCEGTCQSCSTAKKGYGYDGVCEPIAANTDPDNECANGVCDGAGVCTGSPPGTGCSTGTDCASGACANGVCVAVCNGDGVCAAEENSFNCPQDCSCGDGLCSGSETPQNCFVDCKYSSDFNGLCGDGHCDPWELNGQQILCQADCMHGAAPVGTTCGDGICSLAETSAGCPADCGNAIVKVNGVELINGNGVCDPGENWATSPDCPWVLAAGTFIDAHCEGYELVETYADGNGSTQQHTVTTCSESCGAAPWKMLAGTGFNSGTLDGTQVLRPDCTTCTISNAPIAEVVNDPSVWGGYGGWVSVYAHKSYDMDQNPNDCFMAIYPYNPWVGYPNYYSPVPLEWAKTGEKSCSPASPCEVYECDGSHYPIKNGVVGTWTPGYGSWSMLEEYCQ